MSAIPHHLPRNLSELIYIKFHIIDKKENSDKSCCSQALYKIRGLILC